MLFRSLAGGAAPLRTILLQIALAVIAHPLVTRLVAALDRLRLLPLRKVGQ